MVGARGETLDQSFYRNLEHLWKTSIESTNVSSAGSGARRKNLQVKVEGRVLTLEVNLADQNSVSIQSWRPIESAYGHPNRASMTHRLRHRTRMTKSSQFCACSHVFNGTSFTAFAVRRVDDALIYATKDVDVRIDHNVITKLHSVSISEATCVLSTVTVTNRCAFPKIPYPNLIGDCESFSPSYFSHSY